MPIPASSPPSPGEAKKWHVDARRSGTQAGYLQVVFSAPGSSPVDVTFFRGQLTQVVSYSSGDPFGDSTAVVTFPQITIFDEFGAGELSWLQEYANVDLYWVTNTARYNVWEGFVASFEWNSDEEASSLTVQCQGALFQLDHYLQPPMYPARPVPHEVLMAMALDPHRRPNLRTRPMKIEWPAGWAKTAPGGTPTIYTPIGVTPGQRITGFATRETGSWDRGLTGYIQGLLAVMTVDDTGEQWSMRKDLGRLPVLYVRSLDRAPDYTIWAAQPGVTLRLSRDMTQYANVIYGEGTDQGQTQWSRTAVSPDGRWTTYDPMAYDPRVEPTQKNPSFNHGMFRAETFIKFGNGFNEADALRASKVMLRRDMDPGYMGDLVLTIDPPEGSRMMIQAGQVIKVMMPLGTGTTGINFSIASVEVALDGDVGATVTLKIDSKFRDLLTLEEAIVRTRDVLTPVKALQVNKRTVLIEDAQAPWSYNAGSGFIPTQSVHFMKSLLLGSEKFPYPNHAKRYPPYRYPSYYVRVRAHSKDRWHRWTAVPVRMAQKGTIRLTQVACYDAHGNTLKIPYHMSLYYAHVTPDAMPYDKNGPSPFIPGAFQTTDQYGNPLPADASPLMPDPSLIVGWGNYDQPAGYSPGLKSAGNPLTGLLVDENEWTFDCTNNPDYITNLAPGKREPVSAITIYAMFYAEYHSDVFFGGRLFHVEPGSGQ